MTKTCLLIIFSFFFSSNVFCQTFFGTVKDSLSVSLPNANVIAEPVQEGEQLKFAITDYQGRYKLRLEKNITYTIMVSYIGYFTKTKQIYVDFSSIEHDFILLQKNEQLDEIVIISKYTPVMVKKDTLIYNVNAFTDGKEYKMIDVLEKLPGFEIESNGTVLVQGKKVSKIMVENKPFFGGGTKLAIENIPANALDKIEVIDNFNEVSFLKEVSDSKEMILNVKLKKDRSKFYFGDISIGSEIASKKGYYSLNTSLFSYNKETNISYIGNLNNVGQRSISFDDLMRFENGSSTFVNKKNNQYNLSDFAINNTDLIENKSQFSALNLNLDVNSKLNINSYAILSNFSTTSFEENETEYLQNNLFTYENKTYQKENNDLMGLGNLKINYSPRLNSKVIYNAQFQHYTPKGNDSLNSIFDDNLTTLWTDWKGKSTQFNQFLEWHIKHNMKHTSTFVFNQNYQKVGNKKYWLSNVPVLNQYVPYETDDSYTINQENNNRKNSIDAIFKHYWILHKSHHIYFNIGNSLEIANITTAEKQLTSDGKIVDFSNNQFGNLIDQSLNNLYIGLEYKFKIDKLENKFSVFTNFYDLIFSQANNYRLTKNLIEPKWNSEYEFNPSENIEFEYKLLNEFPKANQFFENFTLLNYNTIFKGNALLRNEKYHNATLKYFKHNMYKGLIIRANAIFNKKSQTIRNQIELTKIDQFITPILSDNPETNLAFSGMLEKQVYKFKLSFRTSLRWFTYLQTINNIDTKNNRNSQNLFIQFRLADKKLPNIGVNYKKTFNQFNGLTNSNLTSDKINLNSDLNFLDFFKFKAKYEISFNKNQNNQINNYQIASASLYYIKKNQPLSFEISVNNILNNNFKLDNSYSDFIISTNRVYTLPRIVMLTMRYKI
tara:strand:- start:193 stop:2859 length:2667 start_codon:yes stop_codon:yes gene_type:complete